MSPSKTIPLKWGEFGILNIIACWRGNDLTVLSQVAGLILFTLSSVLCEVVLGQNNASVLSRSHGLDMGWLLCMPLSPHGQ